MSQGQYAAYPRKPIKEIDMAVIGEAFQIVWKNLGPFATASFIGYFVPLIAMAILTFMAEFSMGLMSPTAPASADPTAMFAKLLPIYGMQGIMIFIQFIIMAPFAYAVSKMTLMVTRGQPITVNDAFSGFSRIVPAVGVVLGTQLLTMLLLPFCCIPGMLAGGLLMLSMPLIVDRGMGPVEAMKESFNMLRSSMWMALLLWFITGLLAAAGTFACYIGVIITWPLMYVVPTLVYRDFSPAPAYAQPAATDSSYPNPEPAPTVVEEPRPEEPSPEPPVDESQNPS